MEFYAHSLKDAPCQQWETMAQHEELVAQYCREFLKRIDPTLESWGDLLGRWHDLGKYSNEFQSYIQAANVPNPASQDGHVAELKGRVDHSTAAAQLSLERFPDRGALLAYCFAGHHAGLPDWDDGQSHAGLKHRLDKSVPDWRKNAPSSLIERPFPGMPELGKPTSIEQAAFRVAFWIRMVFSALVDADFLATESFMSPDRAVDRPSLDTACLPKLAACVETHVSNLNSKSDDTQVNRIRQRVSQWCLENALSKPGFFSLCVPTGGGKTLAGLRFGLNHAIHNNLDRVIFAVPFTSIIEQNAKVYRDLFYNEDENTVLEHHSNLNPENETTTNRLQAENWDAPLIVTTNVQLFNSLFACRTSRCRKLHRLANSVIILDEAQTLPIELLTPTMNALKELVETFGCSVVLCSATQPALAYRDEFPIGLKEIQPIVPDAASLHQDLIRTKVEVVGEIDNLELSHQLNQFPQVLCITNTRSHAAQLYEILKSKNDTNDGNFHLSTRMCGAHRLAALDKIRRRLKSGETCRVISTQLIEAGVDVDFPVVYRASCGLDSLAQAAGRCNREGIAELGRVVFFDAETPPPVGFLRQSSDSAKEVMPDHDDLLSPAAIRDYFELHYWKKKDVWDKHRVLETVGSQPSKMRFNFRQMADRYRFIRDDSESLIVDWGDKGKELVKQLENPNAFLTRMIWRNLQRYTVQIRSHELAKLKSVSAVEMLHDRWVLTQSQLYDEKLGLQLQRADGVLPVDDCIC